MLACALVAGTAGCSADDADDVPPTRGDIAAMLVRHAAAVRAHDAPAFLADVAGDAFGRRQRSAFAGIAAVPLSRWSYALGPPVAAEAQRAVRARRGGGAVVVRVTLRYAVRGVDAVATSRDLWWTVVRRDGRAVVVADTDLADDGGRSWRGPWDFGALRVLRGAGVVVLAHPRDVTLARTVLADAARAVPVVTGVVGRGWARAVAVIVPASAAERAAALGAAASSGAEVGAVATSDGQDVLTGRPYGQRVVVVPDELRRLTPTATRLVLQHEITHLATATWTTDATPRWLVEGFADYVGYLGNERPVAAAAAELRALVRRSGVPRTLPTAADFDTAATNATAYQLSWLACRSVAQRHGRVALVRLYRAVAAAGTSGNSSDEAVAIALRQVLHETPARFTAAVRAAVAEQLA
ncbi:hypothetical protein SAMN05443575_2339 [Jatrophihabitans endophyticus]|uniref:Peptidase MA superfamily protein n=1 Tax=Jatrophihabitans endophyticus TaxID=1206085 RepID=A0A1M5L354_9ACTN|nr:hypothetical protein SAMN05443575_2339 [Jatrophihabitans endophyticus]